ncbi:diguanylate cyclase [Kineosporia rhizophila]|uniref:sensor domain-containing diguanylate cyclase n=1 Tax=Kineosporia rhizophila TaxID=84633 RepID=UPI001E51BE42|nr:diguanylate cyclase [Kineosporia rhizophila]MCE0538759.1 diguanylate cyclase [Kineosporia rhizophila]
MTTGDSSPAQASRTAAATSAEAERLAELHSLNILDTPSEPGFDALVTLASQVTGCPISLVSLIDEQRQWFKAKVGTDLCSTDRDIAFCDHVVRDRAELEVPDARLDPRFRDNPLVTGPPQIAFYAGFPISTSQGRILGTLCLLDTAPRSLTPLQRDQMRTLAGQVSTQLELRRITIEQAVEITERRRAEAALADSQANLAAISGMTRQILAGTDARSAIVKALVDIGGAQTASMLELDRPGHLVITGSCDHGLIGTSYPFVEVEVAATVWREGQPLFIEHAQEHPAINQDLVNQIGARSILFQPIKANEDVVGLLSVSWDQVRTDLSERQLAAVALLADESAFALQHDALLRRYEDLAGTDQLTALPNRRAWEERLTALAASARRTHTPFVVAVADVDHFKAYNDAHGHLEGDVLLREVAQAIRTQLRTEDVVARWGGEEFAIALPGCQDAAAQMVLDRVRRAMPHDQTISIGYCQWDRETSLDSLMKRADSALYKAKRTGRDRVVSAAHLPTPEPT